MQSERDEFLNKLIDSFSSFYDIKSFDAEDGGCYCALAQYHSRCEKYVLVRSAQLWAAETHDYAYFSSQHLLDLDNFDGILNTCISNGLTRIQPHKEHMMSTVTIIIVANHVEEKIIRRIKTFKYRKNYKFSFWGWMEVRVAVVDCSNKTVFVNRQGGDVKKHIQKVLA